jgi:hypothetical protein
MGNIKLQEISCINQEHRELCSIFFFSLAEPQHWWQHRQQVKK